MSLNKNVVLIHKHNILRVAKLLIHAFVLSRLDIGNSLHHDVSMTQLLQILRLHNVAAIGNSHASNENRAFHSLMQYYLTCILIIFICL